MVGFLLLRAIAPQEMDKPVAGYYRLSKQEQLKPGTEDSHKFQIERQMQSVGEKFDLNHIYSDIMTGRKNDRPQFQQLLAAVKAKRYKAVFIRLDRMGRNAEFFHEIERAFKRSGTKLYDLGKWRYINFSDPRDWGEYHRAGIQAQEESLTIGYRLKLQKEFTRNQGKVLGGKIPIGYRRSSEGYYEINPDTVETARRMIQIYFESNGSSVAAARQIREELGVEISYQGLMQWLRSPVLRGHTAYYDRPTGGEGEKSPSSKRTPATILWNTHEALLDIETAERIDFLLESVKRQRGRRSSNRVYALSGLLFCDRCGSTATITSYAKRNEKPKIYCSGYRQGSGCGGKIEPNKRRQGFGTDYLMTELAVIEELRLKAIALAEIGFQHSVEKEETEETKKLRQEIYELKMKNDPDYLPVLQVKEARLMALLSEGTKEEDHLDHLRQKLITIAQAAGDNWLEFCVRMHPLELSELFKEFVSSVKCDRSSISVSLRI